MQKQVRWLGLICISFSVYAQTHTLPNNVLQSILNKHYQTYKDQEYFSGLSLSIYVPSQPIQNFFVGKTSHEPNSANIDEKTLFQIGSITKSFTAALILELEKENKLNLDDNLQFWLPNYSKWSQITIQQLLNMTSGLPNYSNAPLWNEHIYRQPAYQWTNAELIDYVYPKASFNPPLLNGYFYTNTGYVLADMIAEKAAGNNFGAMLKEKIIIPADLQNTYYPIPVLEKSVLARMAHGYSFNQYANPEFLGKDVTAVNLTWAAAAGAMISNGEDIIKWVQSLFTGNQLLDANQKKN